MYDVWTCSRPGCGLSQHCPHKSPQTARLVLLDDVDTFEWFLEEATSFAQASASKHFASSDHDKTHGIDEEGPRSVTYRMGEGGAGGDGVGACDPGGTHRVNTMIMVLHQTVLGVRYIACNFGFTDFSTC